jgi:hypothetical protein
MKIQVAVILMLIGAILVSGCSGVVGDTKELTILDKTTYTHPAFLTAYTAYYVITDKEVFEIDGGWGQLDSYRLWERLKVNGTYYCDIDVAGKTILGIRKEMPPQQFRTTTRFSTGLVVKE